MADSAWSAEHHYAWSVTLHYTGEPAHALTPYAYEVPEPPRTAQEYAVWRLGQQIAQYKHANPAPARIVVQVFEEPIVPGQEPSATAEWPEISRG